MKKTRTERILQILNFIAYLAMIGFSIECGSQLAAFIVSFKNPELASRFYHASSRLFALRQQDPGAFIFTMVIIILILAVKVNIWIQVIKLLSRLKIQAPFSRDVARRLEVIAYQLLGVWIIGVGGELYMNSVPNFTPEPNGAVVGGEFLFIAGIVYIVSQIFKRGIEIQEENQLTV